MSIRQERRDLRRQRYASPKYYYYLQEIRGRAFRKLVLETPATWPKALKSSSSNYQLPARNLFLVGKVAGDKEEKKKD